MDEFDPIGFLPTEDDFFDDDDYEDDEDLLERGFRNLDDLDVLDEDYDDDQDDDSYDDEDRAY